MIFPKNMSHNQRSLILNLLIFGVGPACIAAGIMEALGFRASNDPAMQVWGGVLLIGCAYALRIYVSKKEMNGSGSAQPSTASTPAQESDPLPQ